MKKLSAFLLALSLITFAISASGADNDNGTGETQISGTVEAGLRILPVNKGNSNLDYTVYRGDYIVFDFEVPGSYEFVVSDLEINETLPKPETEKPYVKMKKSGTYEFSLGDRKGSIKVIELTEANYTELSAQQAADVMSNTDPMIIDVRTEAEYAGNRIAGAKLLPVQLIAGNIDKLEQFKDQDILLYCASGNRSTVAARILLDAGFSNIYNLRYGIGDWIGKGFPVEE